MVFLSQCFIGFQVPKYISAKNNSNVILEFSVNGKITRKWIKKNDIVLLTDNKKYFLKIMKQFKDVQSTQQKLVDEARAKLDASMEAFTEKVNASLKEFEELKNSSDLPCIVKDF